MPNSLVTDTTECSHSDDEYHDAVSKFSNVKGGDCSTPETTCSIEDDTSDKENSSISHITDEPSLKEEYSDCYDDLIDEEHLRELEEDMNDDMIRDNKEKSDVIKQQSNELFKKGEYHECIEMYTTALKLCPLKYQNDRSILYANRAAAKCKLNMTKTAIDDCSKALELNPLYVRAALRRARLYEETEKPDEALEDYKKVIELDKGNREAHEGLIRLPPLIQERDEKMKREMMCKLKEIGNYFLKPFGLSTDNFEMRRDPTSGGYSINFNQNHK